MGVAREYIHGVTDPEKARERIEQADAQRRRRSNKCLDGWQMNASQRRKELSAIALYRRREKLAVGPDGGWALVIGNLLRVLLNHVTAQMIQGEAAAMGRPPLDVHAVEVAVQEIMGKAWGRYRLYTGAQVGALIELTRAEREETGVEKIESMEESQRARKRRENRERMREKRAADAALKPPTKKAIASMLGISLSKLHRMLRAGDMEIADTISVQTSSILPLPSEDPCTKNVSYRSAHAKRVTGEAS